MQTRAVYIQCPLCELEFEPKITRTNICPNCLISQMDITKDIENDKEILFCRYCKRYSRPPWVLCERDSKELLSICLKKIVGLHNKQIIEAKFIFTEPSSKQIKVQVTIQQEVNNGTMIQEQKVLNFEEKYHQCEDCKREFTPHIWGASIQLRQRVNHKKSFLYLEQIIIAHHMNQNFLKVEAVDDGMNFYFKQKNQAMQMLDFIRGYLPVQIKESKEIYSFIKYTFVVDVPKICKDDLVILPKKLCNQLGGINQIQLCVKVSSNIQLVDIEKERFCELSSDQYFKYENEIRSLSLKENCQEFTILDCQKIISKQKHSSNTDQLLQFCIVDVLKDDDPEYNQIQVKSHLQNIFQPGMTVLGFDLNKFNNDLEDISDKPDIILVKRKPEKNKKRKQELKRLENVENLQSKKKKSDEKEQAQIEEFLEDLDEDNQHISNHNVEEIQQKQ